MLTLPAVEKPRKRGTEFPEYTRRHTHQTMRVTMCEATDEENRGSMGARYVANAAEWAGFKVEWDQDHETPCDIELVSVHSYEDFLHLAELPRTGNVRIAGGHVTGSNPRPMIPFADAICIGEGEDWIQHVLWRLNDGLPVESLAELPGTIVPSVSVDGEIPKSNTVDPVPRHPAYLNRDGDGHARVWYLELARGCPFRCHYCELGWAWAYRPQETEWLLQQIESLDTKESKRVTLFAPDEASHPGYAELLQAIHDRGLITSFGSMRLDSVMKKEFPFKCNMLIRVALDGLTEETRFRVGRKMTDDDVYRYFRTMTERGHRTFKVFMVFGYPWETLEDFDEFEELFERIFRLPVTANTWLRVKFTPLIPQQSTPLADEWPQYDPYLVDRIRKWFTRVKRPQREPGFFVKNDGLMSAKSHAKQVALATGDETLLTGLWRPKPTLV